MKVTLYLSVLIVLFSCFSCQKELSTEVTPPDTNTGGTNGLNSIVGTWKFISVEAKAQSSSELKIANDNQKILAFLNYLSQKNDGIIEIDSIGLNCKGITYKVLSRIQTYRYKNNILVDSFDLPYITTFPQTDSYTPYEIIDDSIFFKKNNFTKIIATKFRISAAAAKIELKDSLLIFTQDLYKDSIENNVAGIRTHTIQKGTAIMTLKRQQ